MVTPQPSIHHVLEERILEVFETLGYDVTEWTFSVGPANGNEFTISIVGIGTPSIQGVRPIVQSDHR